MKLKILLFIATLVLHQTTAFPEKDMMRSFENTLEEIGDSMKAANPGSVKMPEPNLDQIMQMADSILAAVKSKGKA